MGEPHPQEGADRGSTGTQGTPSPGRGRQRKQGDAGEPHPQERAERKNWEPGDPTRALKSGQSLPWQGGSPSSALCSPDSRTRDEVKSLSLGTLSSRDPNPGLRLCWVHAPTDSTSSGPGEGQPAAWDRGGAHSAWQVHGPHTTHTYVHTTCTITYTQHTHTMHTHSTHQAHAHPMAQQGPCEDAPFPGQFPPSVCLLL